MRRFTDHTYAPAYTLDIYGGGVAVEIRRPSCFREESVAFLQGDDAAALLEELDALTRDAAIARLRDFEP